MDKLLSLDPYMDKMVLNVLNWIKWTIQTKDNKKMTNDRTRREIRRSAIHLENTSLNIQLRC